MRRGMMLLYATLMTMGSGCAFLGPYAIEQTHGRYSSAIQRVEEEEFLRNIIRLRYVESPQNLDISAVASQYEFSASAEARPFFSTESSGNIFRSFRAVLPFGSVNGSNRPTVSMTPHEDGTTVRQFLTPISADTLLFLTQSGWPVSTVLRIWVDRLNGIPNWIPTNGAPRSAPTDFARFRRIADLFQISQDQELAVIRVEDRTAQIGGPLPASAITAGALVDAARAGFEYRPQKDGKTWSLTKQQTRLVLQVNPVSQLRPEFQLLVHELNLKPGNDRYEVAIANRIYEPDSDTQSPGELLQITPRSTSQALVFLANGVEIPPEHIQCGLVRLPPDGANPLDAAQDLFHVRCQPGHAHSRPDCASVAVWYRNYWFFIDDRDQATKATFMLMLQLRLLDFKRQQINNIPALTLPVGP